MLGVFREICGIDVDDGVTFDAEGLTIDLIRDELEYGGLRIKTTANIGGARVRIVIDIGFGDAIEPDATELELPVLLNLPAPRLRAYPRETVIAEKFQAMVALGRANSRMKDLYDVWLLSRSYQFEGDALSRAIAATFGRRKTDIPTEPPVALSREFAEDPAKQKQWQAFAEGIEMTVPALATVVEELRAFLMPHAAASASLKETVG